MGGLKIAPHARPAPAPRHIDISTSNIERGAGGDGRGRVQIGAVRRRAKGGWE